MDYFEDNDPYGHIVVAHTPVGKKDTVYGPLLNYDSFDGVSMQCTTWEVFDDTLEWVTKSANAGRKWIVANDEQNDKKRPSDDS